MPSPLVEASGFGDAGQFACSFCYQHIHLNCSNFSLYSCLLQVIQLLCEGLSLQANARPPSFSSSRYPWVLCLACTANSNISLVISPGIPSVFLEVGQGGGWGCGHEQLAATVPCTSVYSGCITMVRRTKLLAVFCKYSRTQSKYTLYLNNIILYIDIYILYYHDQKRVRLRKI